MMNNIINRKAKYLNLLLDDKFYSNSFVRRRPNMKRILKFSTNDVGGVWSIILPLRLIENADRLIVY